MFPLNHFFIERVDSRHLINRGAAFRCQNQRKLLIVTRALEESEGSRGQRLQILESHSLLVLKLVTSHRITLIQHVNEVGLVTAFCE